MACRDGAADFTFLQTQKRSLVEPVGIKYLNYFSTSQRGF